ncbi:cytochrome c [Pseudorhodobacter aquimaris]|uniref:cytochrome c n=1 Tax=Pseudorhodobacter aquimaris TaxID=687412 RepID=UPI00067DB6A3|nr:cytochrome c [Pseudorhodobacter aquimaris]
MNTFLRIITGLVLLGIAGLLAFIFVPLQRSQPAQQLAADWQPAEGQGEYVMHASDCVACHTAEGGAPLAGGRPISSPMGTIWSTNITPDTQTGIGDWSLDDFRGAMIDGIAADGTHLYPAMPYENYRILSEEDIAALYHHLINNVEPVKNTVQETGLPFPFNLRWGIRAWNWLALRHGPGFAAAGTSELQDRGQYLVEGPGHCAACHSPRTDFMTQDGVQDGDKNFLSGGVIGGWNAPPLTGDNSAVANWSVAETADYLATGRNTHAGANGEMGLVVQHSLQYLTDEDNIAIASYLKGEDGEVIESAEFKSMPDAPANKAGEATAQMLTQASPDMDLGPRLYLDNCSGCHFVTGQGAPEIFPPLAGNPLVTGSEVKPLISIILNGADIPSTRKRPAHLVMQGYADRLDDAEVAELASFIRSAWGNNASSVSQSDVAGIRGQ